MKHLNWILASIAVILILLVIGVTQMFSVMGNKIEQQMADEFNQQQLILARNIKLHIENHLQFLESYLKTVSKESELKGIIEKLGKEDFVSAKDEINKFLDDEIKSYFSQRKDYIRFAIMDSKRKPVVYIDRLGSTALIDGLKGDRPFPEDIFAINSKSITADRVAFSRPHEVTIGSGDKKETVRVLDASLPLVAGGEIRGWMALSIDMKMIENILTMSYQGEKRHSWIFNKYGKLVYCSLILSQEYHEDEIHILMKSEQGKYEIAPAHEGHEEGKRELLSTVPIVIGENEWTLVIESGFDEVVGLVRNLNNMGTLTVFLIMLAMAGGGFFLYRWMATLLMAEEKGRLLNELNQEKESLDSILKSIGAAMAVYNKDLTTFWRNEIYDEIAGGKIHVPGTGCCLELDANEEINKDCVVVSTFSNGEPIKIERKVIGKNGDVTHYLINTTPLKDSSGDIFRVMELILDVTEIKTLESQLLQSEKLASIGELASGIAHELNNPMAGIIGYSEFLMVELHDQNMRNDAERIHQEAVRCSKIIQNLLTFARRHHPQEDPVILNTVLDTTVEMIEYEFKVHNIKIEKDYEPNLKIISGDGFQLQQVFLNILNNAFYFLKDRNGYGHIWIKTRNTKKGVRVTLENDGPKLNEGVMQKIFEPFFTTKEVGKGTGLGLSVSHGIIKSHGGGISAANTGRGVAFTVDFPVNA